MLHLQQEMKTEIFVPTIKNDENGYLKLLKLANQIFENPVRHFDLNFSQCSRLDHNAVVMLGALARYVDSHNELKLNLLAIQPLTVVKKAGVMFLVTTMTSVVRNSLEENNFLSHFTSTDFRYDSGSYIGYREHTSNLNADSIVEHLENEWLSADKLNLSTQLKSAIVSRILEIYLNAYGHGIMLQQHHTLGVYSCGQYESKTKKLHMSVLDFGLGIAQNVKNSIGIEDSVEALEWAITKGNSTKTDSISQDIPRGLGIDLLNQFVTLNNGNLSIYSNDVVASSDGSGGMKISEHKHNLRGTLVSITIKCDDQYYYFASEPTNTPFF